MTVEKKEEVVRERDLVKRFLWITVQRCKCCILLFAADFTPVDRAHAYIPKASLADSSARIQTIQPSCTCLCIQSPMRILHLQSPQLGVHHAQSTSTGSVKQCSGINELCVD